MENKRKNKFQFLMIVTAMVLLSTVFASAAEMQGTVIANQGIVRKSGDFDGEVIQTLPIGTKISVLEIVDQWYRIKGQEDAFEGWMYKDIVALEKIDNVFQRGIITASVLNVRIKPSTDSEIIKKLNEGTSISIVGQEKDWYQIIINSTQTGWVSREYVKVVPNLPQAVIVEEVASLRKENKLDASIIKSLKQNDTVYIEGYNEGWYSVLTGDLEKGWIESKDAELQIDLSRPISRSGSRTSPLSNIEEVSRKYLGKKYAWGQTGPDRFDCSGFTYYILRTYYGDYLKQKGIDLPRTSRDQANVGTSVGRNALEVGDLVFFNTEAKIGKSITHVGIYIGSGRFIHASSSKGNVMISSLEEGYYQARYIKAVRL